MSSSRTSYTRLEMYGDCTNIRARARDTRYCNIHTRMYALVYGGSAGVGVEESYCRCRVKPTAKIVDAGRAQKIADLFSRGLIPK